MPGGILRLASVPAAAGTGGISGADPVSPVKTQAVLVRAGTRGA